MSFDFDPSPRTSKRRRTAVYGSDRTHLSSPNDNSALQKVSNTLSGIGKRVFGRLARPQAELEQIDSAYASREDSLNEEEITAGLVEGPRTEQKSEQWQRSPKATRKNPSRVTETQKDSTKVEHNEEKVGHQAVKRRGKTLEQPEIAGSEADSETQAIVEDGSELTDFTPRSSGRQRKRPRRFSIEPASNEKSNKPSKPELNGSSRPQPASILSPSKRKTERQRKSVVFDEKEKQIEQELGFKDIDTSAKKPKPVKKPDEQGQKRHKSSSSSHVDGSERSEELVLGLAPAVEDDDVFFDKNASEEMLESLQLPNPTHLEASSDLSIEDSSQRTAIKKTILSRLTGETSWSASHLSTVYNTLRTLLSATITTGESNSLLLLGARGSGKSQLINAAISELSVAHSNDFHIVQLNGFFQTDDKLALREIWRQLGREMAINESETGEAMGSYADTMASLLSLLSHPDEMDADPNAMEVDGQSKAAKSVVIILDEFDLFTTHPRQTLLYNLFDIAQSRKAPLAVIGCSTRVDVVDYLEKRVKSRFSHRWLHIPAIKTLSMFQEVVQQTLTVAETGNKSEREEQKRWNEYIATKFVPCAQVQTVLQQVFHTTKSIPDVLSALYPAIATLSLPATSASSADTTNADPTIPTCSPPSILHLLPDLPTLHLSLLVCAARLESIYSLLQLNFTATHAHLTSLISSTKLRLASSHSTTMGAAALRTWSKETCKTAWEDLVKQRLLVPVTGGVKAGEGDGGGEGMESQMMRVEVGLDEVGWAVGEKWKGGGGQGDVLKRWCKEI